MSLISFDDPSGWLFLIYAGGALIGAVWWLVVDLIGRRAAYWVEDRSDSNEDI